MSKKLLNVDFYSVGGTRRYNLGCNSSGNIPLDADWSWHISYDKPLSQSGCLFTMPDSNAVTFSEYVAMHDAIEKALAYGPRNIFPSSVNVMGLKMYVNGDTTASYVQYDYNVYNKPILNYYRADGTLIGPVFYALGSMGNNYAGWASGQLYDDGTFVGCAGPIIAHTNLGVYSHKTYEWLCKFEFKDPIQAVNPAIIDDLKQYLLTEPEGAYVGSGVGDFDATSDPVDFPGLPGVSVLDTGLLKMFQMSTAELQALANYLWSGLFDLDTFKKLFSDPMEAILNLSIMPINESTGTTSAIRIGNITTNVTGKTVSNQYKIIDFGTINMNEFWASYADYSPYTRLSIFLPYVGVQAMSIDDVMNGNIQLKAYVDLLTGSVQYILKSNQTNRAGHGHNSVLYTWGGNCQYQIPLTASNMSQVISSITGTVSTIAGGVAATVATGGLTAPLAVGMAAGSISNAMSAKTHVQRGGGIGGSVGIFGVQTPYLILERPEQVYPENYEATKGAPTMQTKPLRYYSGFVRVEAVNLTIPGATEAELKDIEAKLKGGVIV